MTELENLKEELKKHHHFSKEYKDIKAQIDELSGKKTETSPKGEEKTTEKKKEKIVKKEKDYTPEKFEIDPDKTYTFKLRKPKKGLKNVPRSAYSWDESTGRTRKIRLTRTEVSPWEDEQEEFSGSTSIVPVFRDGVLKVKGSNEPLIRYLLAFDGFAKKKRVSGKSAGIKNMYDLYEQDLVDQVHKERKELALKASNIVSEAEEDKLKSFLVSRFGVKHLSGAGLVSKAYDLAAQHPLDFVKDFNNPLHAIKAEISELFDKRIIVEKAGEVKWTSSGSVIHSFNPSKSRHVVDVLARWVLAGSDEAKKFREVAYAKTEQ